MTADNKDGHDDLMKRHQERREVDFIPYHARRSDGKIKFTDDGAKLTIEIEVIGLGTLIILANANFSQVTKSYKWDQSAEFLARIES